MFVGWRLNCLFSSVDADGFANGIVGAVEAMVRQRDVKKAEIAACRL